MTDDLGFLCILIESVIQAVLEAEMTAHLQRALRAEWDAQRLREWYLIRGIQHEQVFRVVASKITGIIVG